MIKACIFDLDGTLADTLESMAYVTNVIMEKFGLKTLPVDNFRYYSGEGASMLIRRALKDAGDPELTHHSYDISYLWKSVEQTSFPVEKY